VVQKLCVETKWIPPGLSIEILRYIYFALRLSLFVIFLNVCLLYNSTGGAAFEANQLEQDSNAASEGELVLGEGERGQVCVRGRVSDADRKLLDQADQGCEQDEWL